MDILNLTKNKKRKYKSDVLLMLGSAYYKYAKNFETAKSYYLRYLEESGKNQHISPYEKAELLCELGIIYSTTNDPQKSLEYLDSSIEICKGLPKTESIMSQNLLTTGACYRKLRNFKKALQSLEDALSVLKSKVKNSTNLQAETYSQLAHLYLTEYINKPQAHAIKDFYIQALQITNATQYFAPSHQKLPLHFSCQIARYRYKNSLYYIFVSNDYAQALEELREAEYIRNIKCPEDLFLKGRIMEMMGEIFLRLGKLPEAENNLTEAMNCLGFVLGPNSIWLTKSWHAESLIRLGRFQEAYNDCLYVLKLEDRERNNLHDVWYWTTAYHAAIATFKLDNYQRSFEHFSDFLKNMDVFCKGFLTTEDYQQLQLKKVFLIDTQKPLPQKIKSCLKKSLKIFTAIYGAEHSFVADYVEPNVTLFKNILKHQNRNTEH